MTKNLETKCPLKSEDGKCKNPYKNKDSIIICPDNPLDCKSYNIYEEVERQRRYRIREVLRN